MHDAPPSNNYVFKVTKLRSSFMHLYDKYKKKKKIETQFLLLQRNPKCWEEKSYHYQIYYCLKLKPFFHEKLFQKEKNKLLLSTCAQQFSGHLFVNGQQKSPVAGLI